MKVKMKDPVNKWPRSLFDISERLCVGAELDRDGTLEIIVGDIYTKDRDDPNYTWLDRSQILALITHLGKVLGAADEGTTSMSSETTSMSSETKFVPRFIANRRCILVSEHTAWPCHNQDDLEWRYLHADGEEVIKRRLDAAAIMAAYRDLVEMPKEKRDEVCEILTSVSPPSSIVAKMYNKEGKYLVIMPNHSVWNIPFGLIAEHRARFCQNEYDGDPAKSLELDTAPRFLADNRCIIEWAKEKMVWDDVSAYAMCLKPGKNYCDRKMLCSSWKHEALHKVIPGGEFNDFLMYLDEGAGKMRYTDRLA